MENLETSLETWVYLDVKTCKVFLCFVAIGRIRAYYVFFVLRHYVRAACSYTKDELVFFFNKAQLHLLDLKTVKTIGNFYLKEI